MVMLSLLVGMGCVSSAILANRAARVFVVGSDTRSCDREVLFEQRTIEAMRANGAEEDRELLAALKLPEGFHPYSVFAFLERQEGIEVVVTTISWGTVLAKWTGTTSAEQLETLTELAAAGTFRCSAGEYVNVAGIEPVFVHWTDDGQVTCVGDWFAGNDEDLVSVVDEIWSSTRQTYEHPDFGAWQGE